MTMQYRTTEMPQTAAESSHFPTHMINEACALFTLPLELRTIVYEILAEDELKLDIDGKGHIYAQSRSSALLRTCQAIYNDFMPFLYRSCVVEAPDMHQAAKGLEQLGEPGRSFVREIHIIIPRDENRLEPTTSDFDPESTQLHPVAKPIFLSLPDVPTLQSVTIRYEFDDSTDASRHESDAYFIEEFWRCFTSSRPGSKHCLDTYMQIVGQDRNDVVWNIEINAVVFEPWRIPPHLPKMPAEMLLYDLQLCVKAKPVTETIDGQDVRRWQFADMYDEETDGRRVILWRKQHNREVEWEKARELKVNELKLELDPW